jgi:hypothetical protein
MNGMKGQPLSAYMSRATIPDRRIANAYSTHNTTLRPASLNYVADSFEGGLELL